LKHGLPVQDSFVQHSFNGRSYRQARYSHHRFWRQAFPYSFFYQSYSFTAFFRSKFMFSKIRGTACHPSGFGYFRNLTKQLNGRNSTTNNDDVFSDEFFGIFVLASVKLSSSKFFPSRIFWTVWSFPSARSIDQPK